MRLYIFLVALCASATAAMVSVGTLIVQRQIALSLPYPYTDREPVTTPERLRYRLKGEPLQAAALRKLAVEDDNSTALLLLSQQVSRRDPVAQALLLDQAALSGRLATTLRHYDILMAITPQTRMALVQTLASAAWQPGIVPALKPYADRPWMDDFLVQTARTADPGTQFATLIETNPFLLATLRKGENPTRIIRILAARGDFDTAFRVADLSARGDRSWRQMDLTKASTDPSLAPLTWQTDDAISKSAIEVNGALFLNAVMPPGIKSPILRRYTRLAPGPHVLTTRLLYLTSTRPQLQWSIQCASLPMGPFAINRLPVSGSARQHTRMQIAIHENCTTQIWELQGTGADSQTPTHIRIEGIDLDEEENDLRQGDSPADARARSVRPKDLLATRPLSFGSACGCGATAKGPTLAAAIIHSA